MRVLSVALLLLSPAAELNLSCILCHALYLPITALSEGVCQRSVWCVALSELNIRMLRPGVCLVPTLHDNHLILLLGL